MDLKCQFCGREVRETVHCKKLPDGFQVDYYQVWTGELRPIVMKNQKDEREVLHFFRLDAAHSVAACRECFQKEEVKTELERAFRQLPEVVEEEEEE